jgi:16S rRNA (cytidine1402-2'-O)-methyltransferase
VGSALCYSEDVTATRSGTLYLVATPIGNLEDITLRALRILREVAFVAAEDTRRTRKLLSHHGIPARVISLHEHNERARAPELIAYLRAGESVALVSDAGTPGLSDPGTEVVGRAAEAGLSVVAVPGASAFLTALAASGLPAVPVTFIGFLPASPSERHRMLERFRPLPHTLVLYEAPHRLIKTLQAAQAVWGDRRLVVARELTKIHEELFRGTIGQAIQQFTSRRPQGEFTLVVAGVSGGITETAGKAAPEVADPRAAENARSLLRAALKDGVAPFEAVRRTAQATGLRRNAVYRIWLALKQGAAR